MADRVTLGDIPPVDDPAGDDAMTRPLDTRNAILAVERQLRDEMGFDIDSTTDVMERMVLTHKWQSLEQYASQLNTIDLARSVTDELASLSQGTKRDELLDSAITKLALDILAGKVEPKTLKEATAGIEALAKAKELLLSASTDTSGRTSVHNHTTLFADIKAMLVQPADATPPPNNGVAGVIDATEVDPLGDMED